MKLIDKDALVAGIERNIKNIYAGREYIGIPDDESYIVKGLIIAKGIIDTLEVKEIDLEVEIEKWQNSFKYHPTAMGYKETAKHFFELGMQVSNKAQKGE